MRSSNTMPATAFPALLACGSLNSVQAAPFPTNLAAMNSMLSNDVAQVGWGGSHGGWVIGVGATAALAIAAGGRVLRPQAQSSEAPSPSSANYDGHPYYGGGYGYDYCPPGYGTADMLRRTMAIHIHATIRASDAKACSAPKFFDLCNGDQGVAATVP